MSKSKLKYLLMLVDDEQVEVRNEVLSALNDYGHNLELDILEFSDMLDSKSKEIIDPIIEDNRKAWVREKWLDLYSIYDEYEKLERAVSLIAAVHFGQSAIKELDVLLNELTHEFNAYHPLGDEIDLAHFLFQEKAILGEKTDYYNPLNSNLINVIKEKSGLPISLCIIYMLVGKRLSMKIEGCGFPGHFLSKVDIEGELILVDCFNGGRLIYKSDVGEIKDVSVEAIWQIVERNTSSKMIIKRMLNNLSTAYEKKNDDVKKRFFDELNYISI